MQSFWQWFVTAVLARWVGNLSLIPPIVLGGMFVFWFRRRYPAKTDQMTFIYIYFLPLENGRLRLILSTQKHFPDARKVMSGHDLSLLRYYVKKSFGRVLRIGQSHSKQLVGNLANMFWAEASSAGQLARSYGLETKSLIVVTCLINISPSEGSTIKHRMVVVPRQYLETLPSVDTVDAPMGMDKDEFCEWMKVLEDIARVFKEEGKHSRSCRVNELVVRV